MDKKEINNYVDKVETVLREVQREYYNNERYVPEHLEHLGLDNITGNASLYDFCYWIEQGNVEKAKGELDGIRVYLDECYKAVDAYRPVAICTWKGFDANVWPSLVEVRGLLQDLSLSIGK